MRKPIWYDLIVIVTVVGFIGCATVTYPPPNLQKDKYTNFEYQYAVDIPEGWGAHDKVPKDLAMLLGGEGSEESKAFKLVLVNKPKGGLMGIINMRYNNSFEKYLKAPPDFFKKPVLKWKENMERDFDVTRFVYNIRRESISETLRIRDAGRTPYKPKEILNIEVDEDYVLADKTSRIKLFMYPCQENKTCMAMLLVSSNRDNCEGNLTAFNEFVSSLTIHDSEE